MRKCSRGGIAAIFSILIVVDVSDGAISGIQRVASGLSSPMFATHAPGDPTRLFIGERSGTIKILNLTTGMMEPMPFLSISGVNTAGEGGLLGMTFHPDYATNGKFYVNVTMNNETPQTFLGANSPFSTRIRQYTVSANPNIANPAATEVLRFLQPQSNHNAGWIGFNPAITPGQPQYLYIPTGDGGGSNDRDFDGDDQGHEPGIGNAQAITNNLLGKILRIDVNGDDFPGDANRNYSIPAGNPYAGATTGDDEIWALGLRNPFRNSFDRKTGDLWLGDVGQSSKEEVNKQPANAVGGDNFGWRNYEGIVTPTPSLLNYRQPVYDYGRTGTFGGKTVIGGYVYRGPDPELQGKYFFADTGDFGNAASNKFWTLNSASPAGSAADIKSLLTPDVGAPRFPTAFGEDAVGNLYIVYLETNEVYRIKTNALIAGDYNADGAVNDDDYLTWRATFGSTTNLAADGNKNNVVDAADYVLWRQQFGTTAQGSAGTGVGSVVPEPVTLAFLVQCIALSLVRRQTRSRRQG